MYTKEVFIKDCRDLFNALEGNQISIPGVGETVLFEEPLIGFAFAGDELFETFRRREAIGTHFMGPNEWLPEARTVVSFFFPISEAVRRSNQKQEDDPSKEWLYARIEGQEYINHFMVAIRQMLEEKGVSACIPSLDERFGLKREMTGSGLKPDFHTDSRWSERHAAYVCGLGTFGLSKGLITEKGVAGRFASVILSMDFEPTVRNYTGIDDYCIYCGACARNCPVNAISLEKGKNDAECDILLEEMKIKYSPRYGCGKCQIGVPCESRIPN